MARMFDLGGRREFTIFVFMELSDSRGDIQVVVSGERMWLRYVGHMDYLAQSL